MDDDEVINNLRKVSDIANKNTHAKRVVKHSEKIQPIEKLKCNKLANNTNM